MDPGNFNFGQSAINSAFPSYKDFVYEKDWMEASFELRFLDGNKEEICTGILNCLNKVEGFNPYSIYNNSFNNFYEIAIRNFHIQENGKTIEKIIQIICCNNSLNILPKEVILLIAKESFCVEIEETKKMLALLPCNEKFVGDTYDSIRNNPDHQKKMGMQHESLAPKEYFFIEKALIALYPAYFTMNRLFADIFG